MGVLMEERVTGEGPLVLSWMGPSTRNLALLVPDPTAIPLRKQAHGGAGVSQDFVLARLWTAARTLRIADGPDEVHLGTIAKAELARRGQAGQPEKLSRL